MGTAYPAALDTFTDWIDGISVVEAFTINDIHAAVLAVETKVGVDASVVTSSHDYKLANMPNPTVNGSIVPVYTKYLTGTLDANATQNIAHGVADGLAKILSVNMHVYNDEVSTYSSYSVESIRMGVSGPHSFEAGWDATNIKMTNKATNIRSNGYRIKINYIL